jgi:hypothetical protein
MGSRAKMMFRLVFLVEESSLAPSSSNSTSHGMSTTLNPRNNSHKTRKEPYRPQKGYLNNLKKIFCIDAWRPLVYLYLALVILTC